MENKNTNKGAVDGSIVIGKNYIGKRKPPVNGMLIEGNVGIGKITPSTALDVSGTITTSGNVGIGTTSPSYNLHVISTNNTSSDGWGSRFYTTPTSVFLSHKDGNGILVESTSNSSNNYLLQLKSKADTNLVDRVVVTNTGRVGIGTTSPEYLLHTKVSSGSNSCCIESSSTGKLLLGVHNDGPAFMWNEKNSYIHFGTNDTERMRITAQGGVGIGTNAVGTTQTCVVTRNPASAGDMAFNVNLANNSSSSYIAYFTNTSGDDVSIKGDGKVGIGTTSPSYKLHVGGSLFYSSGGLNGSDDRIKHNEQPIINALSIISNLTPKHYFKTGTKMYDASHNFIVDSSGNPLDSSGNPLTFKEDYTIETGIIAQEIRTIPELRFAVYGEEYTEETITTYKKDNSGNDVLDESGNKIVESVETQQIPNTLAVDYNSIHCTHIAATKELHQLVQSQQEEIEGLKSELSSIKAHLGL